MSECENLGKWCGTTNGYGNLKCRGDECRRANTEAWMLSQSACCRFEGCEGTRYARECCQSHYGAWARRGFDETWDGVLAVGRRRSDSDIRTSVVAAIVGCSTRQLNYWAGLFGINVSAGSGKWRTWTVEQAIKAGVIKAISDLHGGYVLPGPAVLDAVNDRCGELEISEHEHVSVRVNVAAIAAHIRQHWPIPAEGTR